MSEAPLACDADRNFDVDNDRNYGAGLSSSLSIQFPPVKDIKHEPINR